MPEGDHPVVAMEELRGGGGSDQCLGLLTEGERGILRGPRPWGGTGTWLVTQLCVSGTIRSLGFVSSRYVKIALAVSTITRWTPVPYCSHATKPSMASPASTRATPAHQESRRRVTRMPDDPGGLTAGSAVDPPDAVMFIEQPLYPPIRRSVGDHAPVGDSPARSRNHDLRRDVSSGPAYRSRSTSARGFPMSTGRQR